MANNQEIVEFIQAVAPTIRTQARLRGYNYPAAIIAHACRESGYGKSGLAVKGKNLFGVKAGKSWTGKTIDMLTKEEYQAGTLTTVRAAWRAFDSWNDSIIDYFNLLDHSSRYSNLKSATSEINYFELLRDDGYYTSKTYVETMQPWLDKVHAVLRGMGQDIAIETVEQAQAQQVEQQNFYVYTGIMKIFSDMCDYIVELTRRGQFGNGDDRKQQLGEFYRVIQDRVNIREIGHK